MLICVAVVLGKMVEPVGIHIEIVRQGEDVFVRDVLLRQADRFRVLDDQAVFGRVTHPIAILVSKVGGKLLGPNHLGGTLNINGPMVGGDDHGIALLPGPLQHFQQWRTFKPGLGNPPIRGIITGQFPDDLRIRLRMRECIHKIVHQGHEVVVLLLVDVVEQFIGPT